MNQKARITYRFDGSSSQRAAKSIANHTTDQPERPEEDKPKVVPLFQEELKFAEDIAPWNSPFQDDPFALEKLIRETEQARASQNVEKAQQPDEVHRMPVIDLGDDKQYSSWYDNIRTDGKTPYKARTVFPEERIHRYKAGPSWYKVFASVAGAIATGALFGYMVLSLFAGQSVWPAGEASEESVPAAAEQSSQTSTDTITPEQGGAAAVEAENPVNGAFVQLQLPSQTYYMLQFGVFSNEEGMEAAVSGLKQQGLAAAAESVSDNRVFAGIANDRNQALALSNELRDMEVYIKPIEIQAPLTVLFNGDAATFAEFAGHTDSLIRMLNDLTILQLEQEMPARFGEAAEAAWKETHQLWTTSASVMQSSTAEQGKAEFEQLVRAVNTAAVSLGEFNKNPSRAHLWTAQSALMEAVLAQKAWLEQIVAL
ncbi:SPOR domain-containing protein [Paenibacillus abyssi]|uniref:SPOR domain-containing protein n=1 Tax=Paenibacillus abyssi TaxID=1340531 RepID=A0A917G2U7_9BACL|nr:SPOR domain-containing protein [Paenibacillus abyssi]GGG20393.1 hypothetical protein GCM10010916_41450 [Paenibacillus abyssi]